MENKGQHEIKKWKVIDRKTIIKDRWINLEATACVLGSGIVIAPFYVTHQTDFVVIVAVTEEGELLLVRQYRHGVEEIMTELPAGAIEPGEDPAVAALRELREETGYEADSVKLLLKTAPNATSCSAYAWCYLAEGVHAAGDQELDETEELNVLGMPISKVREALRMGVFPQAVHVAALYRALDEFERKGEE